MRWIVFSSPFSKKYVLISIFLSVRIADYLQIYFQIHVDFLITILLLIFRLIAWHSENICMISVLSNLCGLFLWLTIWSNIINVQCTCEKNPYTAKVFYICSLDQFCWVVYISLLGFCLVSMRDKLRYPTMILDLPILVMSVSIVWGNIIRCLQI